MSNPLVDIATTEPDILTIGDTITWKRTDLGVDYPNTAWTLKYFFNSLNPSKAFNVSATNSDSDYLITITAAVSATYTASDRRTSGSGYRWAAFLTKTATGERVQIDAGVMDIAVNLAEAAAGYDNRSHAKRMLEAIEAMLEDTASDKQKMYAVHGRTLELWPRMDLLKFRDEYVAKVNAEDQRDARDNGTRTGSRILTRF